MTPRGPFSAQPNGSQGLRESTQAANQRRLRDFYYLLPESTLDFHLPSQELAAKGVIARWYFIKISFVRQRIGFIKIFT
jgi:hypothetical protein